MPSSFWYFLMMSPVITYFIKLSPIRSKGRYFSAFLSFPSYKSFEQEGEEVGKGVKLAIEADVLIAELDAVSDVGIFTILSC